MKTIDELKPGKKENAFFVESDNVSKDRTGFQSSKNKKFYIYEWNPDKRKHEKKYVVRNQYDVLE